MTIDISNGTGLQYNANYPLANVNQSSQPFRDNFSIIKTAVENLQSKTITITGTDIQGTSLAFDSGTATVNMNLQFAPNPVFTGVGSLTLPAGSNAQRPSSPNNGMLRFNTSLFPPSLEFYANGTWQRITTDTSGPYVLKSGDTMSGTLQMGGFTIKDVGDPVDPTDAVNLQTGDTRYINTLGGVMVGNLSFGTSANIIFSPTSKIDGRDPSADGIIIDAINASDGFIVRTGASTFTNRSIVANTALAKQGIEVLNSDGFASNPTVGLDINSLSNLASADQTDYLIIYDAAPTPQNKKISVSSLASSIAGAGIFVQKIGDTMSGNLNMGTNRVTNVGNATTGTDALNVNSANNTYVRRDGGTSITGNVNVNPGITIDGRDISVDGATLDAINANSGIVVRSNSTTFFGRSIAADLTSNRAGLSVTNADGTAGNPTIGLNIPSLAYGTDAPDPIDELIINDLTNGNANRRISIAGLTSVIDQTATWVKKAGDTMTGPLYLSGLNELRLNNAASRIWGSATNEITIQPAALPTGKVIIIGDLDVQGATTTIDSNNLAVTDNTIMVNKDETGAGVSLGFAGIEVERGTLPNVRWQWNEVSQSFEGFGSSTLSNVNTITPSGQKLLVSSVGSLTIPTGLTTQRPASPSIGDFRFNTSLNVLEYYDNGLTWKPVVTGSSGVFVQISGDTMSGTLNMSGSGVVATTNGTSSAPGFTFNGETSTGIYKSATNTISFTSGGTNVLTIGPSTISSADVLQLPAGSASIPSISNNASTNTGLYFPAAGSIGFSITGSQTLTVDGVKLLSTVQYQGIGGSATTPGISFATNTNTGIFSALANDIGFTTNGISRLEVDTSKITASLPIYGEASGVGTAANPAYAFTGNTSTGMFAAGTNTLGFSTGGTQRLTIDTTNVTSTLPIIETVGSVSAPSYSFAGSTSTGMYSPTTNQVSLTSNGTQRLTANTTGGTLVGQWVVTGAGSSLTAGAGASVIASYADLAERYEADDEYEIGTVVIFGGKKEITACTMKEDSAVAGVISGNAAFKMNSEAGDDSTHPYVALRGRVPVKVIGEVRKGDVLITSDTPGFAMSGHKGYTIMPYSAFAKSLEDKYDDDEGIIEAVIL